MARLLQPLGRSPHSGAVLSRAWTAPRLAPSTVLTVVYGPFWADPPLTGTGAARMSESGGLGPVAASFDRPGELTSSGGRALRPLQVQTRNRKEEVDEEKTHHTGRLLCVDGPRRRRSCIRTDRCRPRRRQRRRLPGLQRQFHDPGWHSGAICELRVE